MTETRKNSFDPQPGDAAAGIEITEDFQRFTQRNDVFTRAFWDDAVRSAKTDAFFASYRMDAVPRRGDGFTQRDFALRNASWSISDHFTDLHANEGRREGFQAPLTPHVPIAETQIDVPDPRKMSQEIKQVAQFFGADLSGITDMDTRWLYTARVDVRDVSDADVGIPEGMTSVIVMGHAMDEPLVATYPSALAGAATGRAYSHEAAIALHVSAFIRNLGYEAVPSMNDSALVIPFAVKAGLGEYARNQMVITPEFGPRLRFSKIFTNLPLAHDIPQTQGVAQFCDICTKCADACPVKALPFGAPEVGGKNISAIQGVKKWTSDAEACFGFWAKMASDCAICMRVCPFNRDFSKWRHRVWLLLALSPLRKLALWMDRKRGGRVKPATWWAHEK